MAQLETQTLGHIYSIKTASSHPERSVQTNKAEPLCGITPTTSVVEMKGAWCTGGGLSGGVLTSLADKAPHERSVAPQGWRRSSNFKYVLTRNQKVAYHNDGENPHFPCDHLLDPKVNSGGGGWNAGRWKGEGGTPAYSLCTFFDIPTRRYGSGLSHFETSFFTPEIEVLISPHLSSMKSHKWSMRIPASRPGFYLPHVFFSPPPPSDRRRMLLFNLRLQECRGFDGFTVTSLTNGCPGNCIESDYGAVLKGFHYRWLFISKPCRSRDNQLMAPINQNICNLDFFVAPQSPFVLNKTFFFQLISLSGFIHNGTQDYFMGPAVLNT